MVNQTEQLVGTRIRVARLAAGMTQRELASRLNVSKQQIWKYENGETQITVSRLVQIAQLLRISPAILLDQLTALQVSRSPEVNDEQVEILDLYGRLDRDDRQLLLSIGRSVVAAARKKTLANTTGVLPRDKARVVAMVGPSDDGRRSLELAKRH